MFVNRSQSIALRFAEESDAEFILSLRLDEKYNKHLSVVENDIQKQIDWLRKYKIEEKNRVQFYFIIERVDGIRCGTVRIYDLKVDSFCWGSWILNENKSRTAALESAYQVYQFGFEDLGFKKSHFDVRKENITVNKFHQKMGAVKILEDQDNNFYEIHQNSVNKFFESFKGKLL
jgi:RimJ/RimL family protein N-acetyltransferase